MMRIFSLSFYALVLAACVITEVAAHDHHHKHHGKTCHKKHPHRAHKHRDGQPHPTFPPKNNHDATPPKFNHNQKGTSHLMPGGGKAGVAGQEPLGLLRGLVHWTNNWGATPYEKVPTDITFVPQCYGFAKSGHPEDWQRFEDFKKLKPGSSKFVVGGNELDFKGSASAGYIAPKEAARLWDQWIAPWQEKGSVTISPSCAKQRDENWMGPFLENVKSKPDLLNVHLFDDKPENIRKVIDHYAKYNMPMCVTEWACINFKTGHTCSQEETTKFIWAAIELFENDDRIACYSYADADNGDHCHLAKDGKLTASGEAYKAALQQHSKNKRSLDERMAISVPLPWSQDTEVVA